MKTQSLLGIDTNFFLSGTTRAKTPERGFMTKLAIFTVLHFVSITAFLLPVIAHAAPEETPNNSVTLTGTMSCSRCQGYPGVRKGYTRWTWAVHSVAEGDNIVLVVGNDVYQLQGDKAQLLKYMEDKVEVTGNLEARILTVQRIARPHKK